MRLMLMRLFSVSILGVFTLSVASVFFQNCAPVRFAATDNSSISGLTTTTCDPTTSTPEPYTNGDVTGVCSCSATTHAIVCLPTACTNTNETFADGVCTGPSASSLSVLINGKTVTSLVPSTSTVPLAITATGPIQALTSQSNISKVAGQCSLASVDPSQLSVPGGQFALGNQTFIYTSNLAAVMSGCTWRITAIADNSRSAYADFTALLCSAGTADPAHLTCTTADGKSGHTVCTADGLSYQCVPNTSQTCSFNGQTIPDGGTVTAYPSNIAPYGGSCSGTPRVCNNGVLSGTGDYSTCTNTPGATCSFNGQTIADGASVTGYAAANVAYGQTCSSGAMVCHNGNLAGSFPYAACSVAGNPNCSVNGNTLLNGQSLTLYQSASVGYGSSCVSQTLLCNNGAITGDNGQGYFTASSCSVQPPAACNFNGTSVANGASVVGWKDTVVPYGSTCTSESRLCNNGTLSGSYAYNACSVTPGRACSYNGQQIASGATVSGFAQASVAYGQSCSAATATCNDGTLSATISPSCVVGPPSNCTFNGVTVANGASVTGYSATQVEPGQTCPSTSRSCSNGTLTGDTNYQYSSCAVRPYNNCTFQGATVNHGQSVTAWLTASVPYGSTCSSEVRTCNDGTLSGSDQFPACSVGAPASCSFNGQTIAHGQSVTAYNSASSATCSSETVACNNGSLAFDAGYTFASCTVPPKLAGKCWGSISFSVIGPESQYFTEVDATKIAQSNHVWGDVNTVGGTWDAWPAGNYSSWSAYTGAGGLKTTTKSLIIAVGAGAHLQIWPTENFVGNPTYDIQGPILWQNPTTAGYASGRAPTYVQGDNWLTWDFSTMSPEMQELVPAVRTRKAIDSTVMFPNWKGSFKVICN